MHFSPRDQFDLAARVAERFPVPGAAELRVSDLIYGSDGTMYRYLFSAEYTTGVIYAKHRHLRVATFSEPKERSALRPRSELYVADESDDPIAQYEALHHKVATSATSI